MAISRFDEGTLSDALVAYWSADPTENTINKTGNYVTTVESAYGKSHPLTLTSRNAGVDEISHGVSTIGAGNMPCFEDPDVDSPARLTTPIPPLDTAVTGMCVVIAQQRNHTGDGRDISGLHQSGDANAEVGHLRSAGNEFHRVKFYGSTANTTQNFTTNPEVIGYFQDLSGNSIFRINTTEETIVDTPRSRTVTDFYCFGDGQDINNMRGKISLIAIYDRMLTQQERNDVFELAQYWIDNGEAPASGPPTTVTFGPVATNDDASVTAWNWQASSNGGVDWDEAENILTDVSGQDTNSLVVNSATLAEDQTQVRCMAISPSTPPEGVPSDPATLFVQAA